MSPSRTSLCGHDVPVKDVPVKDIVGDVPVEDMIMSSTGTSSAGTSSTRTSSAGTSCPRRDVLGQVSTSRTFMSISTSAPSYNGEIVECIV